MSRLLLTYKRLLTKHPVKTQCIQAGVLCGTGDLIAQAVIEKKPLKNINLQRTGVFLTLGTFWIGPSVTMWYRCLFKFFGDKGKFVALKKVAVDQLLFVPPFQICTISAINILQGHDLEFAKEQLRLKYADILIAGYKLWPAVQVVNFYFVPLNYQTLYVQTVALFWNSYVSWKTQQGIIKE
ncbi:unnamed protein product [Phyllotreta striolata]|uniref:Mitochondrial inner membrane protein Mpv17 n=1 Tax=Phyllotreta striolata TaxID=444603 RepID=A0A9N9TGJ7_PHYSR|nr:unnamed protein product [Phyllotreta striolata]